MDWPGGHQPCINGLKPKEVARAISVIVACNLSEPTINNSMGWAMRLELAKEWEEGEWHLDHEHCAIHMALEHSRHQPIRPVGRLIRAQNLKRSTSASGKKATR
jgi:hypothetical protein